MEIVSDLHLHSKYSRAVSKQMNLQTMVSYARKKGIQLLSAADWTHPLWFKELQSQLKESEEGIYQLRSDHDADSNNAPGFLLSTEVSLIYKQGEKVRRVHNLIFAPSLAAVEKVNRAFEKRGANLHADGRPIIGMSCRELLSLVLEADNRCLLIPCHVWTPHFGVYGSASGFDSLGEAFGDLTGKIYGIETGLSSDPDMNWQIEELRNRSILSFSDAHSPGKMGRELTIFSLPVLSYEYIRQAIMQPMIRKLQESDPRVLYTVEFYPEEGKYHYAGHRNCKVSLSPDELRIKGNICSVCRKKLTDGVLGRVQTLSRKDTTLPEKKHDRAGLQWFSDTFNSHPPFVKMVPLLEIIAESLGSTVSSQRSQKLYDALCKSFHSEVNVVLRAQVEDIKKVAGENVAEAIHKVREGSLQILPGYDGEYGRVRIRSKLSSRDHDRSQLTLDF